MPASRHVTLCYSPRTRAVGTLALLEALDADYDLHVLDMKRGEQRQAPYLAINPMGKVPAVLHNGTLVTEQVAVFIYLADLYPEAGLTPALDDPQRGAYLRWIAFYGSCFEPGIVDRAQQNPPAPPGMSPYGDFDTMLRTLTDQLEKGPYLLGERMTAADILWGIALYWTTGFQLVPLLPVIKAYIERVNAHPAVVRARARDAEILAQQQCE
ncbi:glutathione S-transferase [Pandoraea terrae]|uniref:Glutathione S-transferase n=1 Tax=Pandoraea terrae TaxID=1537710 RepID=A0A5E4TDG6_9BURK|nr:glutathione S-transferase family protein [Pandoraea terrae]VVD86256.1 glutathione S-transferase [Pandoraea terrae]